MEQVTAPAGRGRDQIGARTQRSTSLLVGRTDEQAKLRASLADARAGHGQICLIGGEAGIGKTTLVRDLALSADALGVRVLTGSCHDLSSAPPYGLWLDLFDACGRDSALPTPPAAFAGGQLAQVTDLTTVFADVRRFMLALTDNQPALIILEDLHWADPASVHLLRNFGQYVRNWPVLLVITYRDEELLPDRLFTQHLPALVREAEGHRIDLGRIEPAAIRGLLTSQYQLAVADEDRLLIYLGQHAEGNPFFATEILRTLEGNLVLQSGDDGWSLGPLERMTVPPLLRHVIDGRVARLGEEMRRALAMAAVIGQDVPLAIWARVAELDDDALLEIVDRAVEAHLLEAHPDGTRVRFVHALTREALYEGVLPPRRRAWHRQTAETLLATHRSNPDAIAIHLDRAGDPRAIDWLIIAGERAQRAYAWLTAADRFRLAVARLEGRVGQEHVRSKLLVRIFYVLRFAYPEDANAAMNEALILARQVGDEFRDAEVHSLRGLLLCYIDQFEAGLDEMERGLSALERLPSDLLLQMNTMTDWLSQVFTGYQEETSTGDSEMLAQLQTAGIDYRRSYQGWQLASAGRLEEAMAKQSRFAAILDGVTERGRGGRLAAAFDRYTRAATLAARGQPAAARIQWAQARTDFGDHYMLAAFSCLDELRDVALTYGASDPTARRQLSAAAAVALGRASGALRAGVTPSLAWVRCLYVDGRWDEAQQILDDLPEPGNSYLRRETTGVRAMLAQHRGEPDRAWDQIRRLFPGGPETAPGNLIHQEGLALQRLASELCQHAGNLDEARAWLRAHDRWLAWSGSVLGRAEGHLAWGEFQLAAGDAGQAERALMRALELAIEPAQPLVQLRAHRLLGELAGASDRLVKAETHLTTALALADACAMPFERAQVLIAMAGLGAGHTDTVALAEEARQIAEGLGASPTLVRANAVLDRLTCVSPSRNAQFGLTPRELDVLRLVAEGQTNSEIAESLFISRETARTHVSNMFRKLDVGTRAEAVDRAHRHELLSLPTSPAS